MGHKSYFKTRTFITYTKYPSEEQPGRMQFSQAELHIPHPQVQLGKERWFCSELMLIVTHACTYTHTVSAGPRRPHVGSSL